jgi:hypothetical protein
MLNLTIEETQLKNILKEALIEVFEERHDLLVDILKELIKEKQSFVLENNED